MHMVIKMRMLLAASPFYALLFVSFCAQGFQIRQQLENSYLDSQN